MQALERNEPPTTSTTAESEETVLLEWTVHLMQRDPRRMWAVLAAMVFAALVGYLLFHSALFALLGALMILFATAEYFLPIRYRLTTRRACAAYGAARLEIAWERVKRVLEGPDAVKLLPFARPTRLDPFRGVLLRFADEGEGGRRAEVMRVVEACRKEIRKNV